MHKHRPASREHYGWVRCVLPAGYYPYDARGRRHDEGAHGGIIELRRCSCGAEQLVEVNAGRTNAGPWERRPTGS